MLLQRRERVSFDHFGSLTDRTSTVATGRGQDQLKALTWRDLPALWLPSLPKPSEYQVVRGSGGG
jgi:hypothetical protein